MSTENVKPKLKAIGFNLILEEETPTDKIEEDGIILAVAKADHKLRSGIVKDIGAEARKHDIDISIGDRVYAYESAFRKVFVQDQFMSLIFSSEVMIVEKLSDTTGVKLGATIENVYEDLSFVKKIVIRCVEALRKLFSSKK